MRRHLVGVFCHFPPYLDVFLPRNWYSLPAQYVPLFREVFTQFVIKIVHYIFPTSGICFGSTVLQCI